MEITEVRIFKATKKGPLLAYANIVLDKHFIIRGITLLENKEGRFISMPSIRIRNGKRKYRSICHPLDNDTRIELTQIIFDAYDEFIKSEE